jgi:PIN domain nuclease of toxin-antitoxin system
MLNLDTHVLIDAVEGRLRPDEQRLLADDFWCISDMVLWEIGFLARERRIRLSVDDPRLWKVVDEITVWPTTLQTARLLGQLDFRSDPVNEMVAVTSILHDAPLVTRDARILGSKMVPFALR